jgi:hypothetical protein
MVTPARKETLVDLTAEQWNRMHPVGTPVTVWTGARKGPGVTTVTRSAAWELSAGVSVVLVNGIAGGIRLTHVEPSCPFPPRVVDEFWANSRPVPGGHREWLGNRSTSHGTPQIRYHFSGNRRDYPAAHVAFWIHNKRAPEGVTRFDCDFPQCVEPSHVLDRPGRLASRKQIRDLQGMREVPEVCLNGHDQKTHGSLDARGNNKCQKCASERANLKNEAAKEKQS